ncbi:hypothetical protein AGMMS4956_08460 [Bacteroidia bacterium]|nr:hypothetical protein AGMMS4956_08460 [Bacteroidia bacterium]
MTDKLILTYSLLGYLKETAGDSTKSLTDIFVPIAKKALSDYSKEKGLIEIKGRSLGEIQSKIKETFEIEIPIPILQVILKTIEREVNNVQTFSLYNDGSFIIKSFIFDDIEEQIDKEKENITILEEDYKLFCENTQTEYDFSKLKEFILAQNIDLFSENKSSYLDLNYTIPKYIHQKFGDKKIFDIITNIYLGGIISSYLTLKIEKPVAQGTELLIDTNFFISLIDLNTEDSYYTCKQLFDLCIRMGFRFSILNTTVEQIKILLNNRITDFASKDIIGTVRGADVFNACIRREIDKTQLEQIKDSVAKKIEKFGIVIIQDAQIRDIREKAEKSTIYRDLKQKRDYDLSALNDAIAQLYVQKKKGSSIKEFADVKCWFLHNSFNSYSYAQNQKIFERYSLGANELLVLLWLSNPAQTTSIQDHALAQGTLSSYVTKYRQTKTPSKDILKVIKKRADKAIEFGQVTETDLYRTCIRMSEGDITNEEVASIEIMPDDEFALKLKQFAKEGYERIETLSVQNKEKDLTINKLNSENKKKKAELKQQQQTIEQQQSTINQLADRLSVVEEKEYEREKNKFVSDKLKKDKKWKIAYVLFVCIVLGVWIINNVFSKIISISISSVTAFILFFVGLVPMRFINHSYLKDVFSPKIAKIKYQKEFEQNNPKSTK